MATLENKAFKILLKGHEIETASKGFYLLKTHDEDIYFWFDKGSITDIKGIELTPDQHAYILELFQQHHQDYMNNCEPEDANIFDNIIDMQDETGTHPNMFI